jgi:hypothetical protein
VTSGTAFINLLTFTTMADSEHEVVERQVGKGFEPTFNLDDAFSDGEDGDSDLEFSSAALRKHLAENPSWAAKDDGEDEGDEGETDYGSAKDIHTSISTFYLDGCSNSHPESRSSSPSPTGPKTEEHEQVSRDFSDITLSEEQITNGHLTSHADTHEEATSPPHDTSPYPAVHIDVSRSPPNRVTTSIDTEDGVKEQQEHEAVHPMSPASSSHLPAPSHDLPPLPPSPLPRSPTSPSMRYQRTRSGGQSTFQKVMSKTRPYFLPPKSRQEDRKHMADWEAMMKQSRAAGDFLVAFIVDVC